MVELRGQLSIPSYQFKKLVETWRSLPPDGQPRRRATPPAPGKRAEDRLGPDGIAQLVADYEGGIPTTQLMKLYGLGKGSVLRVLKANGVQRRRQGLTAEQGAEAIRLYEQGWFITEDRQTPRQGP